MNSKTNRRGNFVINLKQIWALMKQYKTKLYISIAISFFVLILSMIVPLFISDMTNILFYGLGNIINSSGSIDFEKLLFSLVCAGSLYILIFIFTLIKNIISTNISKEICFDLRNKLIKKIDLLPFAYFENTTKGDYLSRIINDVDGLGEQVTEIFISLLTLILSILISIIMMAHLNILLTIINIIIIPFSILITSILVKKSQPYFINQQNTLGKLNGYIEESIRGHSLIQIFNKQKDANNKFQTINAQWYKIALKSRIFNQILTPLLSFFNNLSYIIVMIVGAFLCISGTFTVGGIVAFNVYLNKFSQPLQNLLDMFGNVQSIAASCHRITEVLEYKENKHEIVNIDKESNLLKNNKDTTINFESINFQYTKDKPVLKNFKLDIKEKEKIAIVGPTGAGKTTIIKLLLKFYNDYEGSIVINNKDILKINSNNVRDLFAVVMQDVWLFNGTIKDNILYGKPNSSFNEVKDAAKIACADKFIEKLPNKYNYMINENASNLSSGQKQLICIARAIIADKPIIILDEATSKVDSYTEKEIYAGFDSLMKDKTTIIIAHRLSTIKKADKIIVLNNCGIVEQGTHKQLMQNKNLYYKLIKAANE